MARLQPRKDMPHGSYWLCGSHSAKQVEVDHTDHTDQEYAYPSVCLVEET